MLADDDDEDDSDDDEEVNLEALMAKQRRPS